MKMRMDGENGSEISEERRGRINLGYCILVMFVASGRDASNAFRWFVNIGGVRVVSGVCVNVLGL